MYTLGTAAKATGKAKSTISKAIDEGRISAQKNENGSYTIDPAELHRVFPAVSANSPNEPQLDELEPSNLLFENGVLKGELKQVLERLAGIEQMRDRERQALSDQIDDLRKRLDQADEERREKDTRLTALLTNQSAQPAVTNDPPAIVAPTVSNPQPVTRGGFLGLFRKRAG